LRPQPGSSETSETSGCSLLLRPLTFLTFLRFLRFLVQVRRACVSVSQSTNSYISTPRKMRLRVRWQGYPRCRERPGSSNGIAAIRTHEFNKVALLGDAPEARRGIQAASPCANPGDAPGVSKGFSAPVEVQRESAASSRVDPKARIPTATTA
jgi:hypothetical protein